VYFISDAFCSDATRCHICFFNCIEYRRKKCTFFSSVLNAIQHFQFPKLCKSYHLYLKIFLHHV